MGNNPKTSSGTTLIGKRCVGWTGVCCSTSLWIPFLKTLVVPRRDSNLLCFQDFEQKQKEVAKQQEKEAHRRKSLMYQRLLSTASQVSGLLRRWRELVKAEINSLLVTKMRCVDKQMRCVCVFSFCLRTHTHTHTHTHTFLLSG